MRQKFKIKKGDTVVVLCGKDKGKTGEVTAVLKDRSSVMVKGINMVKKHQKPSQNNPGGLLSQESPLHISNVSHVDPESGKPTRVGLEMKDGKKVRVAKKSGKVIG